MNNDLNQNNNQMNGIGNMVNNQMNQQTNIPNNQVPTPPQNNNSNNKSLVIIVVLIALLAALASGGTVYFITSNRNSSNTNEKTNNDVPNNNVNDNSNNQENSNNNQNTPSNNNLNNQNNNEQQTNTPTPVTLTTEELERYLSYIPIGNISFDETAHIKSAYEYVKTTVNDYSKKVLIHNAINHADIFGSKLKYEEKECGTTCPELNGFGGYYDIAYDLTPLEKSLKAMYNLSLKSLDLSVLNGGSLLSSSGESYEYFEGGIVIWQGAGSLNGSNVLERYEANTNELTIYSYRENNDFNSSVIKDAYTGKEFTITGDNETYVKNHKSDFTQYKSVFKKNDTGYYWYSTEVVK